MAFRLPDGFKERLLALARPDEPMVAVLVRAVVELENAHATGKIDGSGTLDCEGCADIQHWRESTEQHIRSLSERIDAITARLDSQKVLTAESGKESDQGAWNPDQARALALEARQNGKTSAEIADLLNQQGLRNRSGGEYNSKAVAAILKRAGAD